MKPYLKGLEFCDDGDSDKCGSRVSGYGKNYTLYGIGVSVTVPYTDSLSEDAIYLAHVIIDLNGKRGPNREGKDVFYFVITREKGFVPFTYRDVADRQDIINDYIWDSSRSQAMACRDNGDNAYTYHSCTFLLMYDGWEIKDDYPW